MMPQRPTPDDHPDAVSRSETVLFQRWLADELSAAEFSELEDRLLSDEAFRRRYLLYIDMEHSLAEELSARPEKPVLGLSQRAKPVRWGLMVLVSAVCLATVVVLWPDGKAAHDPDHSSASSKFDAVSRLPAAVSPRIEHKTAPLQGLPDVAIVTAFGGDAGLPLTVGSRLKPGVMLVHGGELQLDFLGGSRVLLRGPAELHIVSSTAATLVHGIAGVRVPYSQDSFTLSTPEAAVVGAWTEYGVRIMPEGFTRVQLLSGFAEVSLLGDDGSTLISERLTKQAALDVDAVERRFIHLSETTEEWPRVVELDQAQLAVTPDYLREIEQSKPYLYWRFEDVADGLIPDAFGGPYAAKIVSESPDQNAIRIANGVAEFLPSREPRAITSQETIPGFNTGDFSIELWVMPTNVHAAAIFSTVLPDETPAPLHLNFIEVALNTHLVHKPGVLRFLHREPAGQAGGYNLFSQDVCAPGVWTHIVATKTPSELRLFINGQLLRSVTGPGTGASDELSYRLVLGQLGTKSTERQFHGLIDEVAVYRRALRPGEISRHYWSIRRDVPLAVKQAFGDNQGIAQRDNE